MYIEQLVDACLQDYAAMQRGFVTWVEEHLPIWQERGMGETWRRLRIESARRSFSLCQQLHANGATPGQIRKQLREMYADLRSDGPDLYELMLESTGQTEPPHHGTTDDLVQRLALRIMVASAEAALIQAYCAWAGSADTPNTHTTQVIYDLSGVEALALHLGMLRYQQQCFTDHPRHSSETLQAAFQAWGEAARQEFYRKYEFFPEEATTAFTPVTAEGPVDHDDYYAGLGNAEM